MEAEFEEYENQPNGWVHLFHVSLRTTYPIFTFLPPTRKSYSFRNVSILSEASSQLLIILFYSFVIQWFRFVLVSEYFGPFSFNKTLGRGYSPSVRSVAMGMRGCGVY